MNSNECAFVRQLLALRPADWDTDERRRAEAHLAACAACGRLARVYAEQDRALRALPAAGLDPAARQRLLARLAPGRRSGAARPQTTWALGAVALAVVVLVASLLLWQGGWLGSATENTPTIGPTQVLMPSPTITPTTVLSPTPAGDLLPPAVLGAAIPYTPQAGPWNGPHSVAFYGAPAGREETGGP